VGVAQLGGRMRVRDTDGGHSRIEGGAQARGAVLDRQAFRRRDAELLRRQAVARGVGLAAGRELGGDEDLRNGQARRRQVTQCRLEAR